MNSSSRNLAEKCFTARRARRKSGGLAERDSNNMIYISLVGGERFRNRWRLAECLAERGQVIFLFVMIIMGMMMEFLQQQNSLRFWQNRISH